MAWIDSLLSIVVERGADELRVGADREPQMLVGGVPRRLSIPKMSKRDVEDLLGALLSPERQVLMASGERVEFGHESAGHGPFRVTLDCEGGLSATFVRSTGAVAKVEPPLPALRSPAISELSNERRPGDLEASRAVSRPPEYDERTRPTMPLVVQAARLRASDLHLSDGEIPLVRVDGTLRALGGEKTLNVAAAVGLSPSEREALEVRGSVDFSAKVDGPGLARIHAYRAAAGVAAAVRLLPESAPSLARLDMPIALDDLVMLPHGLVLASGPAGAGKSTTLAALAQEALRRRSIVLVTLEDPIEFWLSAPESSVVRRRQVGRDVATFAAGLRDALREDPDVLVVGEMRDPETIALALTAAETGHLVLGSIHSRGRRPQCNGFSTAIPRSANRTFERSSPKS